MPCNKSWFNCPSCKVKSAHANELFKNKQSNITIQKFVELLNMQHNGTFRYMEVDVGHSRMGAVEIYCVCCDSS